MAQLYAKEITPEDKQELDEALQREASIEMYMKLRFLLNIISTQTVFFLLCK